MLGRVLQKLRRGKDDTEMPEDGLWVKVGTVHSDPVLYWLSRTIKQLGVVWLVPKDMRSTHELRIKCARKDNLHVIDTWAILMPKHPEKYHGESLFDAGVYNKSIAFDDRMHGALASDGSGGQRVPPEFAARVIHQLGAQEWIRCRHFFEHVPTTAYVEELEGA